MSDKQKKIVELEEVVIKFAGDSGDGMQLTGTQFSDASASFGNELLTFPDYPAEIRAPQGTVAGVSGFQVHIGAKEVQTPGDLADVLIAMNPAALKTNMKWVKPGATIIVDVDSFDQKHCEKAGYDYDPLQSNDLDDYTVIKAPITSLSRSTVNDLNLGIDVKTADKTRNQFVMGMLIWLFNRDMKVEEEFIEKKFAKKPALIAPNVAVLHAGYNYADTLEAIATQFYVKPVAGKKGMFRQITGNTATAWGLMAGAEKAGLKLFLGSYPITPASDILHELCKHKHLGVKTFQAEDEIAGICTAIGASFGGNLGVTSTSGPGLALKTEAAGLAVITELPLVIVDVQRGGPSTGLPTKTEQSDLLQAIHGRHGESPMPVIAASTPGNCFNFAYEACKIAVEHMTPVILLTDGYLANGTELWEIPNYEAIPKIVPPFVKDNDPEYQPYKRDAEKLNRMWALPGQKGLEHRIGGLEKSDVYGDVSHDPMNHQVMTNYRAEKVQRIANYIPQQEIIGSQNGGELLVIGWGGTFGALNMAVKEMREEGYDVSLAHFNYIFPLPKNTEDVLKKFKKRVVCELNLGQFADYLRTQYPQYPYEQYNKVQGLPFFISELKEKFKQMLQK
ncbi:MAG: 2-oxoacid:acceptor oxidoreductase subunit alpha [Bacteroidales bacterium]|nr:2-oxoacid:acceptor oxidoreductase subunit alpha [Bacteroidales bacterium]MBQ4009462.1 2-oxoacid:acceptor oxidoreductase subunit alpha [Bacteroidales bacterium]MBR3799388.1 2-oxoacid:acceptor oxidoreductase subunit alpha [Bacteroidales bacterium]